MYVSGLPSGSSDPLPSKGTVTPSSTVRLVKPMTAVGGVSVPKSWENSEVLPSGSVAVAETYGAPCAGVGNVKRKLALPEASVVTEPDPSRVRPSP